MKAKLYKPAKTAMQSGTARTKKWLMVFDESARKFVEPLMGWVGSNNTNQQLRLEFSDVEEAIKFAEAKGIELTVLEPHKKSIPPKSYSDNFSFNRIR